MGGVLQVAEVSKRYGALAALSNVSLVAQSGRIHAVLGENGAGKSTLMGVMAGFVLPDSGRVTLDGQPTPLGRPFECKRRGIEMIHQHFTLVPEFTAAENLALARLSGLARPMDARHLAEPALKLAQELRWEVDPAAKVSALPVGVQQRLEILKAISGDAQVLIFDEPTAVLSPDEVDDLFRVLRTLRDRGKIVLLIAHKLSEVTAIADDVSVLRRGVLVGHGELREFTTQQLAELMVGEMPHRADAPPSVAQSAGLHVANLYVRGDRGEEAVRGVSFDIARGEILGIGGVDGNGQVELAEALASVRKPASGELRWDGKPAGYIPQDRQSDGLALGMTIVDNLLISGHRRPELGKGPWLNRAEALQWARRLILNYGIKAESPRVPVASLSGGNQQKVVVSRTLDTEPELLVVVNPTRGLDIKATEYVHGVLREARARGAAIALISTDLDELAALADRTLFMSRGELHEGGATALVGAE